MGASATDLTRTGNQVNTAERREADQRSRPAEPSGAAQEAQRGRQSEGSALDKNELLFPLWRLQSAMWWAVEQPKEFEEKEFKSLLGCHRWLRPDSGVASVAWSEGNGGKFARLQSSHSVWASPVASVPICARRAEELNKGLSEWLKTPGHTALFVTFTVRHSWEDSLPDVWEGVSSGWKAVVGSSAYAGARGDKRRYGIVHYVRGVECTFGKNGWHVHTHVVLMCDRELGVDEQVRLHGRLFNRWSKGVQKAGLDAPLEQCTNMQLVRSDDAQTVAGYVSKGMWSGISAEVSGGQFKQGKKGHKTPFQILEEIARGLDALKAVEDEQERNELERELYRLKMLYQEWCRGSKGRKQLLWSRGAKKALGVDELTEEEIAEKDAASYTHELAWIEAEEWSHHSSNIDLRVEVKQAGQGHDTPEEAQAAVCEVLDRFGVVYERRLICICDSREEREKRRIQHLSQEESVRRREIEELKRTLWCALPRVVYAPPMLF